MKINLAQALKIKNRLAGRIAELEEVARIYNVSLGNQPTLDLAEVWEELVRTRNKLIQLKTALAQGSVGIAYELATLAETKARLAFYRTIPIQEHFASRLVDGKPTEYYPTNYLTTPLRLEYQKEAQKIIDQTQDRVDAYNAITLIDWES